jgi:hypothetical protein
MRTPACSMMGSGCLLAILLLVPLMWAPAISAQQQNATMTILELEELLTRNVWLGSFTFSFLPNRTVVARTTDDDADNLYGTWQVMQQAMCLNSRSCVSSLHS